MASALASALLSLRMTGSGSSPEAEAEAGRVAGCVADSRGVPSRCTGTVLALALALALGVLFTEPSTGVDVATAAEAVPGAVPDADAGAVPGDGEGAGSCSGEVMESARGWREGPREPEEVGDDSLGGTMRVPDACRRVP